MERIWTKIYTEAIASCFRKKTLILDDLQGSKYASYLYFIFFVIDSQYKAIISTKNLTPSICHWNVKY